MKFELDEDQLKKLKVWQAKIKKKHGQYGVFEYRFTPTGIGDCVEVYSKLTGKTIDLTDVDKW